MTEQEKKDWLESLTPETVLKADAFIRCSFDGTTKLKRFQQQQNFNALRERAKALGIAAKTFDDTAAAFKEEFKNGEKATKKENPSTEPILTVDQAALALADMGISVRYDILMKEIKVEGLPPYYSRENAANTLPVYLMDYLRLKGIKGVSRSMVDDCLNCIADQNRYNPVEELLLSVQWDKVDRWQEVFRILGVDKPRYKSYIRKWFMQCIALALNEEDKPIGAEGVLVLQGEQGLAKTSFFRIMSPFPEWFIEGAAIDMRDKDSQIKALSGWITELGELDSTLKREQSSLKAFITSPKDKIRAPYARAAVNRARRTSFCGTVNEKDYLRDDTGSRRFWTVPVESIDAKALFSLKQDWVYQLWAQVYVMYQENPNGFRLTKEEMQLLQQENLEFTIPMRYETEIREMLDYSLPFDQWEWWKSSQVAKLIGNGVNVRLVGKALAKIGKELGERPQLRLYNNPPQSTQTRRTLHGNEEFNIPMKHAPCSMGGMGESGVHYI